MKFSRLGIRIDDLENRLAAVPIARGANKQPIRGTVNRCRQYMGPHIVREHLLHVVAGGAEALEVVEPDQVRPPLPGVDVREQRRVR